MNDRIARPLREFAIIVAGVLVALLAQAWWEGLQERERADEYLRQLLVDTIENERRLDEAIAQDSVSFIAVDKAMEALDGAGPLPSPDSMARWVSLAGSSADFRPVGGTYRALLGTGDLRLIRDDSLRAMIPAYAAALDAESERLLQLREMILNAATPLARAAPFVRGVFHGGIDPAEVDVAALRREGDLAPHLFAVQASNANRLSGLRRLREETVRMRRALEAER